jgi:hypothetical protein
VERGNTRRFAIGEARVAHSRAPRLASPLAGCARQRGSCLNGSQAHRFQSIFILNLRNLRNLRILPSA